MKRNNTGSPGNSAKRFEKMRNTSQMHLQQQFHHQHQKHQQQQHQQQQHQQQIQHQQYYAGMTPPQSGLPPPAGINMMHYGLPQPPAGVVAPGYMYNHPPVARSPHMYKYNVPPPPSPVRTPLPPMPPLPPLPSAPTPATNQQPAPSQFPPSSAIIPKAAVEAENTSTASNNTNAAPPDNNDSPTLINVKPKRKSMSSRYGCPKGWVREDAVDAISLEEEHSRRNTKAPILLLRFPDQELNREIISKYSDDIETVHFQQNSAPRYCFVHLKEGSNVEETIATVSKIPFGTGFVSAEVKRMPTSVMGPSKPEEVDPYTLYIGNLPTSITSDKVKEHFPGAQRIDIGFAQRMKYTRYAFVRYDSVEKAREAFKRSVNTLIETRSLIVRFRRQRSTVASGEQVSKKDSVTSEKVDDGKQIANIDETATQNSKTSNTQIDSADLLVAAKTTNAEATENELSSAFDSPSSIEELENIETDSKVNVMNEVEQWKRKLQNEQQKKQVTGNSNNATRRSSLEEMFAELERRDSTLLNVNTTKTRFTKDLSNVQVKQEKVLYDDELSEEENPSNNLLGLRYRETGEGVDVKTEPDDEIPSNNNASRYEDFRDDFDYDDDFEMELEETDDANWPGSSLSKLTSNTLKNQIVAISPLSGTANLMEGLRKQEPEVSEHKPDIEELSANMDGVSNVTAPSEHTTFMRELYNQVRRAKEVDKEKRPRDDLDALFAQMNSDAEDEEDDDDFF